LKPLSLIIAALWLSSFVYADSPFVGKWKIDEAQSHIAGTTDSVAAAGPNAWNFRDGGLSWTVKADGTDQPTPFGATVSMKVTGPANWQFVYRSNGKVTGTETWVLSADGNSMTRTVTSPTGSGEPSKSVSTVKRTAGKSGFEGTWESTEVKLSFHEVDIEANGDDGITVRLPEDGTHYSVKFDGQQYPETGPRIPAGLTVSAKLLGAHRIEVTTWINGKVFDHEDWRLSADGMTFTYTQLNEGDDKPIVVVQHRMSTR
jgi:hypothetical protein